MSYVKPKIANCLIIYRLKQYNLVVVSVFVCDLVWLWSSLLRSFAYTDTELTELSAAYGDFRAVFGGRKFTVALSKLETVCNANSNPGHSLVASYFNYGILIWGSQLAKNLAGRYELKHVPNHLKKLNTVHNKVIRAITRSKKYNKETKVVTHTALYHYSSNSNF